MIKNDFGVTDMGDKKIKEYYSLEDTSKDKIHKCVYSPVETMNKSRN